MSASSEDEKRASHNKFRIIVVSTLCVLIVAGLLLFNIFQSNFPIFPQWAKYVSKSSSMREVGISLSTGDVVDGEFVPSGTDERRRIAKLKVSRAYIDWKPFLKRGAISDFHINAALPDLVPNTIWKKEHLYSILKENGEVSFEDKKLAHEQWVKIWIGMYGFLTPRCKNECTREEHNKKVLEFYLGKYDQFIEDDKNLGLKKYASSLTSGDVHGHQFFVPIEDKGQFYIDCDKPLGHYEHYQWCTAYTMLNHDMHLKYQFEIKHLQDWKIIDNKVRSLVNSMLIYNETKL
jgi:hypothetical protein